MACEGDKICSELLFASVGRGVHRLQRPEVRFYIQRPSHKTYPLAVPKKLRELTAGTLVTGPASRHSYSDLQRHTTCQVDTTLWDERYM